VQRRVLFESDHGELRRRPWPKQAGAIPRGHPRPAILEKGVGDPVEGPRRARGRAVSPCAGPWAERIVPPVPAHPGAAARTRPGAGRRAARDRRRVRVRLVATSRRAGARTAPGRPARVVHVRPGRRAPAQRRPRVLPGRLVGLRSQVLPPRPVGRVPAASTAGPRTNPGTTPRTGNDHPVGPEPPTGARRGRPVGAARLTPPRARRGRADRCPGLQVVVDPQRPQIATGRHAGFPGAATSGPPGAATSGPPVVRSSGPPVVRSSGPPVVPSSGPPVVRSSGLAVAPRSGLAVDSLPTAGRAPGGNLLRSATRRSRRRSPPAISIGLFGPSCPACPRYCSTSSAGTSSWPDV